MRMAIHALTLALVTLAALGWSASSHAKCDAGDVNHLLNQILHDEPSAGAQESLWKKEIVPTLQKKGFDHKFKFNPPSYTRFLVTPQAGSIASKTFKPNQILRELETYQMDSETFLEQFEVAYRKNRPTRDSYITFYENRYQIYRSGMEEFLKEIKIADPTHAQHWENTVKAQMNKVHQTYKAARANTVDFTKGWTHMHNNIMGATAELHAGLSMAHLKGVSIKLKDVPQVTQAITQKIKEYMEEALQNPGVIDELTSRFPLIFKNRIILNNPGLYRSPSAKLQGVAEWIKSKEIDVISEENGKMKWLEVKRNSSELNDRKFDQYEMNAKTYREQILENKEVMEFLDLENAVELEYLATGGVNSYVESYLKSNGIKVHTTY